MRALALLATLQLAFVTSAQAQELRASDRETSELAAHSLAGPWAETGTGMGLVAAAPIVTLFTAFALGPPLFGCGWDSSDDDESERYEECERSARAQSREAMRTGLAIGIPIGVIGLGLVAHGAYRVGRIRQARRRLAAFSPTFSAHARHVELGLTLHF